MVSVAEPAFATLNWYNQVETTTLEQELVGGFYYVRHRPSSLFMSFNEAQQSRQTTGRHRMWHCRTKLTTRRALKS